MLEWGDLEVSAEIEEGVAGFGCARGEDDLGRVFEVQEFGDFGAGLLNGVVGAGTPGVERMGVAVLGGEPGEHRFQSGGE